MELQTVNDFIKYCRPVKGCYYNLDSNAKKRLQSKYNYLKEHRNRKVNYIPAIHKFIDSKDYVSLYKNCELLIGMILWKQECIVALENL